MTNRCLMAQHFFKAITGTIGISEIDTDLERSRILKEFGSFYT